MSSPSWSFATPADLLHMLGDSVPSIRKAQALQYVGHLKSGPVAAESRIGCTATTLTQGAIR